MKQKLVYIFVLFLIVLGIHAQGDGDNPPVGYLDSCNANPIMFAYFGPNCLNPVTWDLDGFYEIDTWIFFVDDEGITDAGVIKGYTWNFVFERYDYWVMTQMPFADFGGAYNDVPVFDIIEAQANNS